MANPRILLKRSDVAGKIPTDSDLNYGELALNYRDRKLYFKDANNDIVAFIDSGAVQNLIDRIDTVAQAQLDSDEVFQIIDSAYVNARLDLSTILDSAEIKDFIDSDYIRNKIDEAFTNSFTIDAETLNGESADYYLDYDNFTNTPTILDSAMITRFTLDSSEIIQLIDSAHIIARFGDSAAVATEAYRFGGQDPAYYLSWNNVTEKPTILDNIDVVNIIDSAHVQLRQKKYNTSDFVDSAYVLGLPISTFENDQNYIDTAGAYAAIDSNFIRDRQIVYNTSDFLDSDTVDLVVDSAYVRLRQQKYNTSDFLDSNTVTFVVNGAYVKARQTTYNTSDFLDSETVTYVVDSQYVRDRIGSTIDSVGVETLIDSAYINARVAAGTDSSTVSAIILNDVDSAYVQARQTAQDFSYTSLTDLPDFFDSLDAETLIDSAYVQARQTTQDFSYTSLTDLPDFFDSSDAETLIDSAYVRARIGSTIDSAYFDANIPKFGTDYVDSAAVVKIIGDEGIDSDLITNLVDSAYIQLRDRFQDSAGVISLIDSAFVRARIGSTIDSAGVETLVDSAYVRQRVKTDQDLLTTSDVTFNTVTADLNGAIEFTAKNDEGSTLTKGTVVYIKGVSGNKPTVAKADASDPAKMPAFGIVSEDANDNSNTIVFTFGTLYNLDTSAFNAGDTLYVSATAGELTNVKPAGEGNLLQNIGRVIRSHASAGSIKVGGAGRTNATPNLDNDQFFLGNDSNYAIATDFATAVRGKIAGGTGIEYDTSTGTINVDSNSTITINRVVADSGDITKLKFETNTFTDVDVPNNLPTFAEGNLFYFQGPDALTYSNASINIKIGQDEVVRVYNNTGTTIAKGKAVYVTGAANDFPTIALAKADNFTTVYTTIGLTSHSIADGAFGFVTMRGLYGGLNTAAFNPGDIVHVSFDSAGELTNTQPQFPNYPFEVGTVLVADSAGGGNVGGCIQVNPKAEVFEGIRVDGNSRFDADLTVAGNLNILGTETVTKVQNLQVTDNFIYIGAGDTVTTLFDGNGTNDASIKDYYEGDSDTYYFVVIHDADSANGGDLIRLHEGDSAGAFDNGTSTRINFDSDGGQATLDLSEDRTLLPLRHNLKITFETTGGHDSGDYWYGLASPVNQDLGIVGNYNLPDQPYSHAGFFRDASDQKFKVFNKYDPEVEGNINTSDPSFELGTMVANTFEGNLTGNVTGNVTGTVSDISNHSTTNLSEGDNLYYTKARVDSDIAEELGAVGRHILPAADSTYDLGSSTQKWRDLYLSGNSLYLGGAQIHRDGDDFRMVDSQGNLVRILASNVHTALVDSSFISGLIDTAYVQARQDFAYSSLTGTPNIIDSDNVTGLIDSAYINARTEAGTDSAATISLIQATVDSAYIQLRDRQRDSGFVTNIIDSAYINARTEAGTDSATTITLITETIDSAYINARTDAEAGTDSSTVVAIIDSHVNVGFINALGAVDAETMNGESASYYLDWNNVTSKPTIPVQNKTNIDALNIDADTLDGQHGTYYLNYSNFTGTPNVLDSSEVKNIFNENGDNQLETERVVGLEYLEFLHDSDVTTFLVEVSTKTQAHRYEGTGSTNGYVIRNQEAPMLQLVPGNKYRFDQSNGTNAGHPIAFYYDAAKTTQYSASVTTNGVAGQAGAYTEIEVTDMTPQVLHYQCTAHGYMGNAVFVMSRNLTGFDTDDLTEGSTNLYYTNARVTAHVDSDYVAQRQDYSWSNITGVPKLIDSALVTQLIDSAYISARESGTGTGAGGLDSDAVFAIIDSAYIQAREAISGSGANVAYKTISISGQDDIVAATATDTLTFEAGTNITLATDAATKTVTINSSGGGGGGVADGLTLKKFTFTADSGQITFTDSDDNGQVLSYNKAGVDINVYLNGVLLVDSDDFTKTDSSTVTLIDSAALGDNITIVKFTPPEAAAEGVDSAATITLIRQEVDSDYIQARQSVLARGTLEVNKYFFEADQGDTVFSGADKFGNTFLVDPDNTEVYINGILQELTTDYTIVDSNVTFTEALDSGYSVSVIETVGRVVKKTTLAQTTFQFTADSGQTVFSGTDDESLTMDLSSGVVEVYLNGILLSPLNDFTREGNAITLTDAADSADLLSVVNTKGTLVSSLNVAVTKITDATGTTLNKAGFRYVAGSIQVFKNGELLAETTDYTATDGTNINLTVAAVSSDVFLIQQFSGAKDLKTVQYQFLADSGQRTFTGEDRRGDTLTYASNATTVVYVNGIALQDSDDYTATNGYEVTLTTGAALNDDIKILSYVPADLSKVASPLRVTNFEFTADSGQATFSGADDNSETLSYSVGRLNVFLNGILLQKTDFTATTGTSIVLTEAADSGDVLTAIKYTGNNIGVDSATVLSLIDEDYIINNGGGGTVDSAGVFAIIDSDYIQARQTQAVDWVELSTNIELDSNSRNIINTTNAAINLILPPGPALGDEIRVIDGTGNAGQYNITIERNGENIMGADSDLIIDIDEAAIGLVYYNTARGWILIEN